MSSVDRYELIGRDGDTNTYRRTYVPCIPNTVSEDEVEAWLEQWVLDNVPNSIGSPTDPFQLTGFDYGEMEVQGSYELECEWIRTGSTPVVPPPTPAETGTTQYKFSYVAQGYHAQIVYGDNHIGDYEPEEGIDPSSAQWLGAIGIEEKDKGVFDVAGMQVEPAQETFSVTYYPNKSLITPTYELLINDMMGGVNQGAFYHYSAYTLQLVRCQGSIRTDEDWQVEFGFAFLPLLTEDLVVMKNHPRQITIPAADKKPHDLVWFQFSTYVTEDKKWRYKLPRSAHVERVWPLKNFSSLNLPPWW